MFPPPYSSYPSSPSQTPYTFFPQENLSQVATLSILQDLAWFLDSGANYHLTSNSSHITNPSYFPKNLSSTLNNSNNIPINFYASNFLSTPQSNFHLHNLIYVPKLTKNLISILQLCQDNNVFIKIFPLLFLLRIWHKRLPF